MACRQIEIDRDKLRAAIRTLGTEYVVYMLDDAIDLLPPVKLHAVVKKYVDLRRLRPDRKKARKANLLADVKVFEKASLAGAYYESFHVDSRNFMEKSRGTTAWIAECRRLLDRCVRQARTSEPADVGEAFDILFRLLDRVDGREDVIFFADEGGAWQVGIDWEEVLPRWFKVLSATAEPEQYWRRIGVLLERHYHHGGTRMLAIAGKIATPAQRRALGKARRE